MEVGKCCNYKNFSNLGQQYLYGEHTTSVDGNGKNPGEKELLLFSLY